MGPVRLQFDGTAQITERDEAAKRIIVHASGADEKGRGQASMVVTATLVRAGGARRSRSAQDLQLSGAAAQYGRGMISDVTSVLMRDFSANMEDPHRGDRAGRVARPDRRRRGTGQRPRHRAAGRCGWRWPACSAGSSSPTSPPS